MLDRRSAACLTHLTVVYGLCGVTHWGKNRCQGASSLGDVGNVLTAGLQGESPQGGALQVAHHYDSRQEKIVSPHSRRMAQRRHHSAMKPTTWVVFSSASSLSAPASIVTSTPSARVAPQRSDRRFSGRPL